ncbi:hypothetical protein DFA_09961 [Cavenderia fasciculata]|uniref:Uncharacterized protein n=1 Tax=Cavenderia fasciculata TaxID=261658 RepID=F4Q8W8_CACFS|nr:uncharacterized protein DFA_09961 [Cavenderia fasciculata]EGG15137.1 hypothetical protein DFA_09961 [Cavenderia fasciculata]|eukprot:XP_004351857.1 hypothetical protein DFA_09961 [Cavenderia fasciculata]
MLYQLIRQTVLSKELNLFKHVRDIHVQMIRSGGVTTGVVVVKDNTKIVSYSRSLIKSYNQIKCISWMCQHGYFNLLKDKLEMSQKDQLFSLTVKQENIRMLVYYSTHVYNVPFETFQSIYKYLQEYFYDDSVLAYCGRIDILSFLLLQTSPRRLDPFTPFFNYNHIYLNRYTSTRSDNKQKKNTNLDTPFKPTIEYMITNSLCSIGNIDLVQFIINNIILNNNNNNSDNELILNQIGLESITSFGSLLKISTNSGLDIDRKYKCIRYYYDTFLCKRQRLDWNNKDLLYQEYEQPLDFGFKDIGQFYQKCKLKDVASHLLLCCDQEIANRIISSFLLDSTSRDKMKRKLAKALINISPQQFQQTPIQCRQSYISTFLALNNNNNNNKLKINTNSTKPIPFSTNIDNEFISFQLEFLEHFIDNHCLVSISPIVQSLCNYFSSFSSSSSASPSSSSKKLVEYLLQLHQRCLNIGYKNNNMFDLICLFGTMEQIQYASNYINNISGTVKEEDNFIFASSDAIDNAASRSTFGLDIVKYLHTNRTEGCSEKAFVNCQDPSVMLYLFTNYESMLYQPEDDSLDNHIFGLGRFIGTCNQEVIQLGLKISQQRNDQQQQDQLVEVASIAKPILKMKDIGQRNSILELIKDPLFSTMQDKEKSENYYHMFSEACSQGNLELFQSLERILGCTEPLQLVPPITKQKTSLLDDAYLNGMNIDLFIYLIKGNKEGGGKYMDKSFIQIIKYGTLKEFKWLESHKQITWSSLDKIFVSSAEHGNLEIFNYLLQTKQPNTVIGLQQPISPNCNQVMLELLLLNLDYLKQQQQQQQDDYINQLVYFELLENENVQLVKTLEASKINFKLSTKQTIHLLKRANLYVVEYIQSIGLIDSIDYHVYHILNCFTPIYIQQLLQRHQQHQFKFDKYQPNRFKNIQSSLQQQKQKKTNSSTSSSSSSSSFIQMVFSNHYLLKKIISYTWNPKVSKREKYLDSHHSSYSRKELLAYKIARGDEKNVPFDRPQLLLDYNFLKVVLDKEIATVDKLVSYSPLNIHIIEYLLFDPNLKQKVGSNELDYMFRRFFSKCQLQDAHNSWLFKHRHYLCQQYGYLEKSAMPGLQYSARKSWSTSKPKKTRRKYNHKVPEYNQPDVDLDKLFQMAAESKKQKQSVNHLFNHSFCRNFNPLLIENGDHKKKKNRSMKKISLANIHCIAHHLSADSSCCDKNAKEISQSELLLKKYMSSSSLQEILYDGSSWRFHEQPLSIEQCAGYIYSYFYNATLDHEEYLIRVVSGQEEFSVQENTISLGFTNTVNKLCNRLITKMVYQQLIHLSNTCQQPLFRSLLQLIFPNNYYGLKFNQKLLQEREGEFEMVDFQIGISPNNDEYHEQLCIVIENLLDFKVLELCKKRYINSHFLLHDKPKTHSTILQWILDRDGQSLDIYLPYYYYIVENWQDYPIPLDTLGKRPDLIQVYQQTLEMITKTQPTLIISYQLAVVACALFYGNIGLLETIGWEYINIHLLTVFGLKMPKHKQTHNEWSSSRQLSITPLKSIDYLQYYCIILINSCSKHLPENTIQLYHFNLPLLLEINKILK